MTNIIPLPVITSLNLPPERVLQAAMDEGMQQVIIIGIDADGCEYFASSVSDGGDVLWAMERAKLKLLRMADDDH